MRRILSSIVLALPVAAASPAQNLLTNPELDDDVVGWDSEIEWIAGSHDAENYIDVPESGSARVVNTNPALGAGGIVQCATIPESNGTVPFEASVWARVDDGEAVDGVAMLGLWFLANDTCDLANGLLASLVPSHGVEFWGRIHVEAVYPAGTRSVRFDLRVDKFVEGGDAAALFDHAYLPEPESGATAAGAGAALVALLRRGRGV